MSPVAIADSILGLEAKFQFGANPLLLNDRATLTLPRITVRKIVGLYGRAEFHDLREPRYAQHGEVNYGGLFTGKTITYEGRLQASSLQELRSLGRALRGVFYSNATGQFFHRPQAAYGSISHFYWARCMQLEMDDDQVIPPTHPLGPWQRDYVLGMRQLDPRFYVDEWRETATNATQVTIWNDGTADSPDLVVTVTVPAGNPNITITDGGGKRLRFLAVPAGQLIVDYRTRKATVGFGGADVTGSLDVGYSNWWDQDAPGLVPQANNTVTQSGGNDVKIAYRVANW